MGFEFIVEHHKILDLYFFYTIPAYSVALMARFYHFVFSKIESWKQYYYTWMNSALDAF